jgi:hypothetical protein
MAKLVVPGALLGIVEDLVGLGDLLELLLGRLVAGVPIRVVLEGEFSVGLLDRVVVRPAWDAERFVAVALAQDPPSPAASAETMTWA